MSPLTDRELAVLETVTMRLHTAEALKFLKEHGIKQMSERSYFRIKKKLEDKKLERLYHIAAIGFEDQHLERISTVEACVKLMWENYHKPENTPSQRVKILESIISAQPYLSSYYEASKDIMEDQQDAAEQTKKHKHLSE